MTKQEGKIKMENDKIPIIKISKDWGYSLNFDELCQKALFGFRALDTQNKDNFRPHFAMRRTFLKNENDYAGVDYVLLAQHNDGIIDNAEGFIAHDLLKTGKFVFYSDCKKMVAEYLISIDCAEFVTFKK